MRHNIYICFFRKWNKRGGSFIISSVELHFDTQRQCLSTYRRTFRQLLDIVWKHAPPSSFHHSSEWRPFFWHSLLSTCLLIVMALSDRSLILPGVTELLVVWSTSVLSTSDGGMAGSGIACLFTGNIPHVLKPLFPVLTVALPRASTKGVSKYWVLSFFSWIICHPRTKSLIIKIFHRPIEWSI
jgi:hypothetical protein